MRKYNLPPNHALFTSQSPAELHLEIYEDLVARQDSLRHTLEHGDPKIRRTVMDELNAVNESLGEQREDFDPVTAKWEADLEAGNIPDLTQRG